MLESGSVSSCTSSVISGLLDPPVQKLLLLAHRLPARCLQLPRLQGSRSPRLVFLSPQSTQSQYLGATTTTRGEQHQRSLRTFNYGDLRRRSLRDLDIALSLGKGRRFLNCW
jgi:hypothetical protein